ncbi:Fibronectin type III domain-containing protein [Paenibacillus sp. 1_12]|uniref:fibronectin type III domain-containing protein n=1 Tax=Paenibacillus sp. 1_12 TaxID=1566278 RepID=UPI0008E582AD|nr:fibronectin type III domain-containing protein [Paenibacillus sp. 1_12]SFK66851.1 Fibronectin type III domain-containing protein [Paenibacillus sp. 1_12]
MNKPGVMQLKSISFLLIFLPLICSFGSEAFAVSSGPDTFITKNNDALPFGSMSDVAYGNNQYIAVGSEGSIIRSVDAESWVNVKTKADITYIGVTNRDTFSFNSVAYGNGIFVSTGRDGVILTSTDGTAWTQRTSGINTSIGEVKYLTFNGSSAFYVLTQGKFLKSTDGISWTSVVPTGLDSARYLTRITVRNAGARLAVGNDSGDIYSTTNGTAWTTTHPKQPGNIPSSGTNMLTWMNDRYFISDPSAYIWTSTDLSTFTLVGSPFKQNAAQTANQMFTGFYDGSKYYLFGYQNPYYGAVYTSSDAVTWTLQTFQHEIVVQNVEYVNGKYFRLGNGGLLVSSDGQNWSYKWGGIFYEVIYDGAKYLAIGKQGNDGGIWTSVDLASWSAINLSSHMKPLVAAAFGNNKYVAIGELAGTTTGLATSSNGSAWSVQTTINDSSSLYDIAFGAGKFVAIGTKPSESNTLPVIKTSADGVSWSEPTLPANTFSYLNSIAFINNEFIVVGNKIDASYKFTSPIIWTSSDGQTWANQSSGYPGSTEALVNIIYDGSKYVLSGYDTESYEVLSRSSADLSAWSAPSIISGSQYNYGSSAQMGRNGNNIYVMTADSNNWPKIYYSGDAGQTWQDSNLTTSSMYPVSIMEVNNQVIISGDSKLVMTSVNTTPISNFAITGKTSTTATFSWTAASGATGVIIQQSPAGANTWATATTGVIANNATSATVTGLSAASAYDFRLVVTGGTNAGNSNVVNVTTDASPVSDFANTAKTSTTAAFSWTAASGATGVIIQQSPAGANTWATATTGVIANNATSATVTGLSAASAYDFRLVVTGGSNAGNSNELNVTTNASPVSDFANTAKTSTTAAFSWTAASGATGVIIQQSPAGANTWTTATTSVIANNATSATVTGLNAAVAYDFRLVVTGDTNAGNSNVVNVTTNASPVSDFASTSKTSTTAAFSWTAASGATGVIIQQSPSGANTWTTATTVVIGNNATSATVTGLSAASAYDFRLVVTGGTNAGNSNVVNVTTNASPVSDFANTAKTSTTAAFSWTAASGATSIIIQQSPAGANTWTTAMTGVIANNAMSTTVTGLSAASAYDFRLVVTGGTNAGNSNVVNVTTIASPVSDFANTSKTSTTAAFSWTAASGATGVIIQQSPSGANTWTTATTGVIGNNATSATVTGLSAASAYDFRLVVTGGLNAGNSNIANVTSDAALTYTITGLANQTVSPLVQGYDSNMQETKTVSIANTGTGNLTNLLATLSGTNASNFLITQPALSLNSGEPATSFTVTAKAGLAAGTYTASVTVSADGMTPVTFTVTQVVNLPNAPANPQNLTARGGDRQITLNWDTVTGATYYSLYMSTTLGQFGNASVTTLTYSNYKMQNLENGTAYYFIVKAGNLGGLSAASNQVSAAPVAVPAAPTNVTAFAGNGQATVTFTAPTDNGGSVITGYEVTVLPGNITVTGATSPITINGLANGVSYTFTVKAVNGAGKSVSSVESNMVLPMSSSNSNSNSNSASSTPEASATPETSNTGVNVLVNGKAENAGTATTSNRNDKTVTTIVVEQKKLDNKLATEGQRAVVTIPVNAKSDVIVAELNGQMVKNMEGKQAVLEIKTDLATYTIPAQQINISAISDQVGMSVALQDIKIQVEISVPLANTVKVLENAAAQGSFTLVVPPVEFKVIGTYGEKTVEVSKFDAYVERTIAIPDGVDPNRITTGIVVEPDGTVRHVPTKVVMIDSKYYAKINSLTNSTYSIVWHPLEFKDVANHWAKTAVNDMGSRMVISGSGNDQFSPNRDITRAEFTAIIVRGLGLKLENSTTPISDVKTSDWYSSAINTAYAYQLINGFEDGTFRPNDNITREQAMVIIAKAMTITNLKAKLTIKVTEDTLRPFIDSTNASTWASSSIADSIQAGIVSGRSATELEPKANITRAEVAAIIQRLLQKSDLI